MNGGQTEIAYFNPQIPGLEALLLQEQNDASGSGFIYYPPNGLNLIVYGPPGSGKTILALQMAFSASTVNRKRVIYLSKDTPAQVLWDRIRETFKYFGHFKQPEAEAKKPWHTRVSEKEGEVGGAEANFILLDGLQNALLADEAGSTEILNTLPDHFLGFGDYANLPGVIASVERYAMTTSAFHALGHLQPRLKPLFHALADSPVGRAQGDVFIVCDSLSPSAIEENLQLRVDYDASGGVDIPESPQPGIKVFARPLTMFVMESTELPPGMTVAFPPDVQIRLGFREESHNVRTRTIQLLKTRFQKSLDEPTPLLVIGHEESVKAGLECVLYYHEKWLHDASDDPAPRVFSKKKPGIEIIPPLLHEQMPSNEINVSDAQSGRLLVPSGAMPARATISFCIPKMDSFTDPPDLAAGGCTLLVTQNRCASTALSLHYLLGQIGRAMQHSSTAGCIQGGGLPKSVLYISFSDDVEELIQTIWNLPLLRAALRGDPSTLTLGEELSQLKSELVGPRAYQSRHRLYKIPLRHTRCLVENRFPAVPVGEQPPDRVASTRAFLYIYVPDFTWITVEEAMERVSRLLTFDHHPPPRTRHPESPAAFVGCGNCLEIDRIVFDRVGRLQGRWPLVENCEVFVSSLVALCARHGIELMLVDDTAQEDEATGAFHSRWTSVAKNIVRLRRIPFHGTEPITIELVSAGGRLVVANRPHEIEFRSDGPYMDRIVVEDSFRGYTGVTIGRPERCKIRVDLSYDEDNTPLRREVEATKQNLENTMDAVEVRLLGPGTWSGINSAFSNLSTSSRDICHIVAIDGIWLESLLRDNSLHHFSNSELKILLPKHIIETVAEGGFDNKQPSSALQNQLNGLYATETITIAAARLSQERNNGHAPDPGSGTGTDFGENKIAGLANDAIPMRHNWGVFTVTRLSRQNTKMAFDLLVSSDPDRYPHSPLEIAECLIEIKARGFAFRTPQGEANVHSVLSILFGEWLTEAVKADLFLGKIYRLIWERLDENNPQVTWDEIADFRTNYWAPFWKGGWADHRLVVATRDRRVDPRLLLLPRIDLFDLATTSEESLVSFLLELLLTHVSWDDLFNSTDVPPLPPQGGGLTGPPTTQAVPVKLLRFNTTQCEAGFVRTMVLFFRLLSPAQRRNLATGFGSGQHDIGGGFRDQVSFSEHQSRAYDEWPRQISLLSRQWLTTVQNIMPRYDLRECIDLLRLPSGTEASYWSQLSLTDEQRRLFGLERPGCGMPVAGTWYLGILKGGNADLGTDVVKEIVSREHEMSRLLNRCGAPVSTDLYAIDYGTIPDANTPGATGSPTAADRAANRLPYGQIMNLCCQCRRQTYKNGIFFPFHRTQIDHYLEITPILYNLIRHVMRIQVDEADLRTSTPGHYQKTNDFGTLTEEVRRLVRKTIVRLATFSKH